MTERIIRTGVGGYLSPDGMHRLALMGAKVDVDDSDLERFDSLHGEPEPERRKPGRPRKTDA